MAFVYIGIVAFLMVLTSKFLVSESCDYVVNIFFLSHGLVPTTIKAEIINHNNRS